MDIARWHPPTTTSPFLFCSVIFYDDYFPVSLRCQLIIERIKGGPFTSHGRIEKLNRGRTGEVCWWRICVGGGDEMRSQACELCYLLAPLSWKTQLDPPHQPGRYPYFKKTKYIKHCDSFLALKLLRKIIVLQSIS